MSTRFVQSIVSDAESFAVVVYDLKAKSVVADITDYAEALVHRLQLTSISVQQEIGYLRSFWEHLSREGRAPNQVDEACLTRFRDAGFAHAKSSKSHRGSEDAAKRTVNSKLVRVYDWLLWMKDTRRVRADVVGRRSCSVLTSLSRSSVFGRDSADERGASAQKYPLLFRLKAGNSKHTLPRNIPTEETVDRLHEYFHSKTADAFVAHRNCIMIDIASYTGFRRASIQSLRASQFVGRDFTRTSRDTVIIKPARQKFGYTNTFEIPAYVHEQVATFVRGYLLPFVEMRGIRRSRHQDHIFLSSRDGSPLSDRAMTKIASDALRGTGATKGTALHVFRSKYTVECTLDEYEERAALGLSTSTDSIDRAVARTMGWRAPESARPYTSWAEAEKVAARRRSRADARERDKVRIQELEGELGRLRRTLEDLGSPSSD